MEPMLAAPENPKQLACLRFHWREFSYVLLQTWEGWRHSLGLRLWEGLSRSDRRCVLDAPLQQRHAGQACTARQQHTEELWQARREVIRADHRAANARTELAQSWRQRLITKGCGAASAPAAGAAMAMADGELHYEDEPGLGSAPRPGPDRRPDWADRRPGWGLGTSLPSRLDSR